jgi:hypothetical protein
MEISFFALPSIQDPVQGRFKPAHLPISLSTKVAACVRRFETPTAMNYGRTESKKDISMLFSPVSFLGGFRISRLLHTTSPCQVYIAFCWILGIFEKGVNLGYVFVYPNPSNFSLTK